LIVTQNGKNLGTQIMAHIHYISEQAGANHPRTPDWGGGSRGKRAHHGWKAALELATVLERALLVVKGLIQCVSKNIHDVFSYNSRKHCRIFI